MRPEESEGGPRGASGGERRLRLWPGVLLVVVQWALRFGLPAWRPEATPIGVGVGLLGGLAVALWWVFFSRARRAECWGALVLALAALGLTWPMLDESVATGMQGLMFGVYAMPGLCLAFVGWALLARGLRGGLRWGTMAATIFVACGAWALVRTGGFDSDLNQDLAWRWSPTREELLLARTAEEPVAPAPAAAENDLAASVPAWPGFRGPDRDGVVRGTRVDADWSASPPTLLWRRAVGPGWSSFAVWAGRVYTQEQRGEEEVVACYDLATGAPLWRHGDPVRFWESNAGAGPRGTPTMHDGRLYTLGATGALNALDARDGARFWSRDAARDASVEAPEWGFAASPLVAGELVVVGLAGHLRAYDRATGEPRWAGPTGGAGYSSPQRLELGGVEQLVFLSGAGASGVDPAGGALLWEHAWEGDPIVQPARTADGALLINVGDRSGVRCLDLTREAGAWTVSERWTSIRLKPFFNDFVVHGTSAYGFDGGVLACIDLTTGARRWKGGRYGRGQLLLLADQDLLLVLGEQGELVLVDAAPDAFVERARVQAIEGKTWNHPVLVGELLLVRNAQEMAAFRLPQVGE